MIVTKHHPLVRYFIILLLIIPVFTFADEINFQNQSQFKAKKLYERITGVKIRSSYPKIKEMALLIENNKYSDAAAIAVNEPQFINIRARNLALALTTKNGSLNIPINDSAALILGTIRDNLDFRSILTGNYYYDLKTASGSGNNQLFLTSNFYSEADSKLLDLNAELTKIDQQIIGQSINGSLVSNINANSTLSADQKKQQINSTAIKTNSHPDAAGILTTRYFSSIQLSGGSNRRAVEYVVNSLLCSNMSEIGNNKASDAFVGKDVDRFPGGNPLNYIQNCKSCHTILDSFRGAFAKTDYSSFTSDQVGFEGIAHGSLYKENKTARDAWLNSVFNENSLNSEINSLGASSTYHMHLMDSVNYNPIIFVDPAIQGETLTYAQAVEREKFRLSSMLLAVKALNDYKTTYYTTYTGVKTNIDAAVTSGSLTSTNAEVVTFKNWISTQLPTTWSDVQKNLYLNILTNAKTNLNEALERALRARRFFKGGDLNSGIYTFYNSDATLKNEIAVTSTVALSATNVKDAWKLPIKSTQYFIAAADGILKDVISNYLKIKKADIDAIFAKKDDSATITLYSNNCLSAAVTMNYSNFLTCELDLNKDKSIIGSYILSVISANSSAETVKAYTFTLLKKGYGVATAASNSARDYWYSYLNSINNRVYFNASNFDPDTGVSVKMNRGSQSSGYTTTDDQFTNLASNTYGWRGPNANGGKGLKNFGQMISDSEAFSKCITKRLIKSICYIDLPMQSADLKSWSVKFESANYNVKKITTEIASSPFCGILKGGQ